MVSLEPRLRPPIDERIFIGHGPLGDQVVHVVGQFWIVV